MRGRMGAVLLTELCEGPAECGDVRELPGEPVIQASTPPTVAVPLTIPGGWEARRCVVTRPVRDLPREIVTSMR